jgi:GNAT superfamily N-acetyltransferase
MEVTVTYLEMKELPAQQAAQPPRTDLAIVQAVKPAISFYRYLYNAVGKQWQWVDRRKMGDDQLAAIVQHQDVEIHVLYAGGVPAGYAELDRRQFPDIELAYFGIMPEFIGEKLGPYLLRWAIDKAWTYQPCRLWLHTCTLDHPKALATYQHAGFKVYDRRLEMVGEPVN